MYLLTFHTTGEVMAGVCEHIMRPGKFYEIIKTHHSAVSLPQSSFFFLPFFAPCTFSSYPVSHVADIQQSPITTRHSGSWSHLALFPRSPVVQVARTGLLCDTMKRGLIVLPFEASLFSVNLHWHAVFWFYFWACIIQAIKWDKG